MKEIIIEVPDRFGQELKPYKVNTSDDEYCSWGAIRE